VARVAVVCFVEY